MNPDLLRRLPLLTDSAYRTLQRLEEHPHAPRYTHPGYHRLTQSGLAYAATYEALIETDSPRWTFDSLPNWLSQFVADRCSDTPIYRRWQPSFGAPHRTLSGGEAVVEGFTDLPTTSRADLNREPWAFVPDDQTLDDLVVYNTSGTTGHPLSILTQSDTLALYVPLLKAALRVHSLAPQFDPSRVAIAYITYQKQTYTYAIVSPLLNDSGLVKINLHPDQWRDPNDAAKFLNDCNPVIYTGTPLAFAELAKLKLAARPLALISTSMTLSDGLQHHLEQRFECPVINIYSTNETGPIAVASPLLPFSPAPLLLLQPRLYVEILDSDDLPCPPGVRGEITVTGGINPLLPLIRYRTGDYAALAYGPTSVSAQSGEHIGSPLLTNLEGRAPVVFRATDGTLLNNIDVSIALRPFAITQFQLHQFADGSLKLKRREANVDDQTLRTTLLNLFGINQQLSIEDLIADGKVIQYTSDLTNHLALASRSDSGVGTT